MKTAKLEYGSGICNFFKIIFSNESFEFFQGSETDNLIVDECNNKGINYNSLLLKASTVKFKGCWGKLEKIGIDNYYDYIIYEYNGVEINLCQEGILNLFEKESVPHTIYFSFTESP